MNKRYKYIGIFMVPALIMAFFSKSILVAAACGSVAVIVGLALGYIEMRLERWHERDRKNNE